MTNDSLAYDTKMLTDISKENTLKLFDIAEMKIDKDDDGDQCAKIKVGDEWYALWTTDLIDDICTIPLSAHIYNSAENARKYFKSRVMFGARFKPSALAIIAAGTDG